MAEGNNLYQFFAHSPIKEGVDLGAGDADMLAGQVDRLVVLDGEVVVVDPVDGKGELGRGRWTVRRRFLSCGGERKLLAAVFSVSSCSRIIVCKRLLEV